MKRILWCSIAVLFIAGPDASASTIDFQGMGKADVVHVMGVRDVTAWAGELNWSWISGQPAGWPSDLYTYCVDLLHNEVDPQTVTVSSTDLMTTATVNGAQKAAWLFNSYASFVHGASGTNDMAAGLQLAIWEVLYDNAAADGTYSLTSGSGFRVDGPALALTAGQNYLDALSAAGSSYLSSRAVWLDAPLPGANSTGGQDQITAAPIPEPASLFLVGSGIVGLAARRRRRQQA